MTELRIRYRVHTKSHQVEEHQGVFASQARFDAFAQVNMQRNRWKAVEPIATEEVPRGLTSLSYEPVRATTAR